MCTIHKSNNTEQDNTLTDTGHSNTGGKTREKKENRGQGNSGDRKEKQNQTNAKSGQETPRGLLTPYLVHNVIF